MVDGREHRWFRCDGRLGGRADPQHTTMARCRFDCRAHTVACPALQGNSRVWTGPTSGQRELSRILARCLRVTAPSAGLVRAAAVHCSMWDLLIDEHDEW